MRIVLAGPGGLRAGDAATVNDPARKPLAARDARGASGPMGSWVVEALKAGVAVVSLDPARAGHIEFANGTLAAMVGSTVQELLGQPCFNLVPTDRDRARAYFQKIAAGSTQHVVCHLAGTGGTAVVADVHAGLVRINGAQCAVLEFRRWRSQRAGEPHGPASIRLDLVRCEVRVGTTVVPLSRTQFEVLAVLLERRGEVVSHAALARAAWGRAADRQLTQLHRGGDLAPAASAAGRGSAGRHRHRHRPRLRGPLAGGTPRPPLAPPGCRAASTVAAPHLAGCPRVAPRQRRRPEHRGGAP